MPRAFPALAALGLFAAAGVTIAIVPPDRAKAQSSRTGAINPGILRFCENQRGDGWVSRHAPRDPKFFHQELVLGEGSYTLTVNSGGKFRFDVYVYDNETKDYLGGDKNVTQWRKTLKASSGKRPFLVQLVKTSDACRGCAVSMSLDAYNCRGRRGAG